MKSGFFGMLAVALLILCAAALSGAVFFSLPGIIICIALPIGLAVSAEGAVDTACAIRSLRCLITDPKELDISRRNADVLRHMISYSYAAGIIGWLIGTIQLLYYASGIRAFSLSLLTVFYAVVICECILRPGARRLEKDII